MTNICLTLMLLTLPLLVLQRPSARSGLHAGLWVSLFYIGRLHASFSIIVFSIALFDHCFRQKEVSADIPDIQIRRPSMPQFLTFLSSMIIFCALGKVYPAYGEFLHLEQDMLYAASITGFLGSLIGPILFGRLSDRKGPFPAMITLILLAASSIAITAYSAVSSLLFPIGEALLWLSVSGTFVLLPIFMQLYFGRRHLSRTAPAFILFMTALWSFVYYVFDTDGEQIRHAATFLTFAVYLILTAALFSFLAWKNRLVLVK